MKPICDEFWLLSPSDLTPKEWHTEGQDAYVFNPTMCASGTGFALVYRVVLPNSDLRRLASCRLDENMQLIPESVTPLSDLIRFEAPELLDTRAQQWHADPRYFVLGGKTYLSWNDGASAKPINHQFLLEMDELGLKPNGKAREIITTRDRRPVEKNWMFFEAEGETWCIYTTFPHDIMKVDLSNPDIVLCKPAYSSFAQSDYETLYGIVRGGAQPIHVNGRLLVLAHSSYKMVDALRYYACMVYEVEPKPPFRIIRCGSTPFSLPTPVDHGEFKLAKLNPTVGGVIYPCGVLQLNKDELLISYGINDEAAAVARVPLDMVLQTLQDTNNIVRTAHYHDTPNVETGDAVETVTPDLFWWDAAGKSFDGNYGARKFEIGNFGDIASRDVVERISNCKTGKFTNDSAKLLAIGSIMVNARDGDVVWGSGVKGTAKKLDDSVNELDVRAVRGPLSANVLHSQNIDLSKVTHVFDPGSLVAHLFEKEIDAYDVAQNQDYGNIRIVPHYRDDIFFRRMYPEYHNSFLSVDETPQGMVEKMLGAEAVFSSSLHGIIFAESLGIPAYWLTPHGGEDTFKYYDYYYGTGRYNIQSYDDLRDALKAKAQALPNLEIQSYLDTFPHDRIPSLSRYGLQPGDKHSLGSLNKQAIQNFLEVDWSSLKHNYEGMIVMKKAIKMRVPIGRRNWQASTLTLNLNRTKGSLRDFVRIIVKAQGEVKSVIEWQPGEFIDQTCEIFLPESFSGQYLDIEIFNDAGNRASFNIRKISADPVLGSNIRSFMTATEREENRKSVLDEASSAFEENELEWSYRLDRSTRVETHDDDRKYLRIMDGDEIAIPVELLTQSRLLFLAGPSTSSATTLERLRVTINNVPLELNFMQTKEHTTWNVKALPPEDLNVQSGLVGLQFHIAKDETLDPEEMKTFKDSLLVRKMALAKATTHRPAP